MSLSSRKASVTETITEVFPSPIIPGRYGAFNPTKVPYAEASPILENTLKHLLKLQTSMVDLARSPRGGEPVRGTIQGTLEEAMVTADRAAAAISLASRNTEELFRREVDDGERAIASYEKVKGRASVSSRIWFDIRCLRWRWCFKHRRGDDLNKLHDAYDDVVANARLVRLAREEGYEF